MLDRGQGQGYGMAEMQDPLGYFYSCTTNPRPYSSRVWAGENPRRQEEQIHNANWATGLRMDCLL